jgi:glutaredoxin 3
MELIEMGVVVYSTDTCPWCEKTKEYLKSLNVDFESKNVSGDREAAMEMVKKTHQMGVPVTQVGEQYIVGYDPDKINAALKAEGLLK